MPDCSALYTSVFTNLIVYTLVFTILIVTLYLAQQSSLYLGRIAV